MQKIRIFHSILIAALIASASISLQANTCDVACNKFSECLVNHHAKAGNNLSASQRAQIKGGCMKTCRKNKAKTLACYQNSANSCMALWNCVQSHYK